MGKDSPLPNSPPFQFANEQEEAEALKMMSEAIKKEQERLDEEKMKASVRVLLLLLLLSLEFVLSRGGDIQITTKFSGWDPVSAH